jgi:RNA polymerase sigma factor (TIGR02999 family)
MDGSGSTTTNPLQDASRASEFDPPCSASSVYPVLRRIARSRLRSGRDALLDTTALVHESFIRFAESGDNGAPDWSSLVRYAPRIMRNIVVDSIRRRNAQVHGGDAEYVELDTGLAAAHPSKQEITAVFYALEQLGRVDARLAQVVEMRFFEGMSEFEIGRALGLTERTVRRDWEKAKLLLAKVLRS